VQSRHERRRQQYQSTIESLPADAVNRLIEMRRNGGAALRKDLLDHCGRVRGFVEQIRTKAPLVVEE